MGLVTTLTLAACVIIGMRLEAVSAQQPPSFAPQCPYSVSINETVSNTIFDGVSATDATLYYKKNESGNGNYFSVNSENGSLSIAEVDVDTSQDNVFNFTVVANNTDGEVNCLVSITITDVNDNAPVFDKQEYTVNLKDHVESGSSIVNVTATDQDRTDPNNRISYSLNGTNSDDFAIDAAQGLVTVNAKNLSAAVTKKYMLQILATDGGSPKHTGTASLNVYVGYVSDEKSGKMGQTWSSATFVGSLVFLLLLQEM